MNRIKGLIKGQAIARIMRAENSVQTTNPKIDSLFCLPTLQKLSTQDQAITLVEKPVGKSVRRNKVNVGMSGFKPVTS